MTLFLIAKTNLVGCDLVSGYRYPNKRGSWLAREGRCSQRAALQTDDHMTHQRSFHLSMMILYLDLYSGGCSAVASEPNMHLLF